MLVKLLHPRETQQYFYWNYQRFSPTPKDLNVPSKLLAQTHWQYYNEVLAKNSHFTYELQTVTSSPIQVTKCFTKNILSVLKKVLHAGDFFQAQALFFPPALLRWMEDYSNVVPEQEELLTGWNNSAVKTPPHWFISKGAASLLV